jgi:acyl carrier protein
MPAANVTCDEVAKITIELMAAEQNREPAELRAELETEGGELPIDSQLIAEVLARVEDHFGVRIPADNEAARSLRSVMTFADTIVAAAMAATSEEPV